MNKQASRELYRNAFKKMLSLSDEEIEWRLDEMEYSNRNRKSGDNVVSLDYYGRFLPEETIKEFERNLETLNLQLSSFDKTRVIQASVIDYITHVYITTNIQEEILKNIAWDFFVKILSTVFDSAKNVVLNRGHEMVGVTFDIETNSKENNRKLILHISPTIDKDVAMAAVKAFPQIVKIMTEESKKSPQKSKYKSDTLTLNEDGKWGIKSFESPEYLEKKQKKRKGSKK